MGASGRDFGGTAPLLIDASDMFNRCEFEFEIVSVNITNDRLVELGLKKKWGARWNFRIG
jgi:hypothetical protein